MPYVAGPLTGSGQRDPEISVQRASRPRHRSSVSRRTSAQSPPETLAKGETMLAGPHPAQQAPPAPSRHACIPAGQSLFLSAALRNEHYGASLGAQKLDRAHAEAPAPKWDVPRCRQAWNPLTSGTSRTL